MAGKPPMPAGQLRPQYRDFCHFLIQHWKKGRAAVQAGFAESCAGNQATKLLKREDVQDYLLELSRASLAKIDLEDNDVLRGLGYIATVDLGELIDKQGNPMPIHDLPEQLRRALQSIKFGKVTTVTERRNIESGEMIEEITTVTTQVVEIKLPDRLKAYELVGRHLQLFTEDDTHRGEAATLIIDGLTVTEP